MHTGNGRMEIEIQALIYLMTAILEAEVLTEH